jgi:hypothetical protein
VDADEWCWCPHHDARDARAEINRPTNGEISIGRTSLLLPATPGRWRQPGHLADTAGMIFTPRAAPPSSRLPAGFVIPAQPSLASKPPSGPGWVHEIKHDGYRMIAAGYTGISKRFR